MTELTKLADALESMATYNGELLDEEWSSLHEAARILRAAAGVDVAGLMAMAKAIADAAYSSALDDIEGRGADSTKEVEAEAALESALRLALAAREWFVLVPVEPTPEMMDAARSLTSWPDGIYRAMTAAAPKGTYPQEDRSREPPCHACGLGYKCRSANCPNTTPDPMTGPHRKEHHDQP